MNVGFRKPSLKAADLCLTWTILFVNHNFMILVISILLLVLAIIQMVVYCRYGINILKPMNRHDRKRIRLRRKGIVQQKPVRSKKRNKRNMNSGTDCAPYNPESDPGYMDEIDEYIMLQQQQEEDEAFWEEHR